MDLCRQIADGFESDAVDGKSETRSETHRAHHAKFVFREAAAGLADGANDSSFEVRLAADEVEHFAGIVAHQQAVDREIAALNVFLRSF